MYYRLFRLPTNKPVRLKSKHKLIAEAFQQKQQKKGGRKASLDFHTSHDDPLGELVFSLMTLLALVQPKVSVFVCGNTVAFSTQNR